MEKAGNEHKIKRRRHGVRENEDVTRTLVSWIDIWLGVWGPWVHPSGTLSLATARARKVLNTDPGGDGG